MPQDDPLLVLSTKIPQSLKERLRALATELDLSQSRLVYEALVQYLERGEHSIDAVADLKSRLAAVERKCERLAGMVARDEAGDAIADLQERVARLETKLGRMER